nr:5909_t:CDS:2 [Entrophospora candida]
MSLEQIWHEYKHNHDGDHYTDNASVVFVPTASGARGYDAVRQFLAKAYDTRVLKISEKLIYSTVGNDSIVEESETTIQFVSGDGSWVVPGVDSRYTIDNKVVIPTVTSAKFEGDRISSIVITDRQAESLTNIANAHLNPFGKTVLSAGFRVNQPGGTGGKSSIIFSNETDDPVVSRTRFNSNKNASQFSIGDDDDTASQADTLSGHSTRQTVKPSSRVLKPPGGGGSQITFG